jgi:integrase
MRSVKQIGEVKKGRATKPRVKNLRMHELSIHGRPVWRVVTPRIGGGAERKMFRSKADAQRFFDDACQAAESGGINTFSISEALRADALRAAAVLEPFEEATLLEAAKFYARHLSTATTSKTVAEAVTALIRAKEDDGLSHRYTKDLRNRLGRFVQQFGNRQIGGMTVEEIEDWLRSLNVKPLTRNTFWLRLSVLFKFSLTRKWCSANPLIEVSKAKRIGGKIGVLTVEQFGGLLGAASAETVPYFAIGGFAGLRSSELERLNWEDVDLEVGLITLGSDQTKTASRRHVTILPALAAWLKPYGGRKGKLCPVGLRARLEADRRRAGIQKWPANALRHSFASYHLSKFSDSGLTAMQLGHTKQQVLFRDYHKLVRPAAARDWFNIKPAVSVGRIVEFAA